MDPCNLWQQSRHAVQRCLGQILHPFREHPLPGRDGAGLPGRRRLRRQPERCHRLDRRGHLAGLAAAGRVSGLRRPRATAPRRRPACRRRLRRPAREPCSRRGTAVIDEDTRANADQKLDHSFKIIQVQAGISRLPRQGEPRAWWTRALETIEITAHNGRGMIKEEDGGDGHRHGRQLERKGKGKDSQMTWQPCHRVTTSRDEHRTESRGSAADRQRQRQRHPRRLQARHGRVAGRRGTWTSCACRKSARPTRVVHELLGERLAHPARRSRGQGPRRRRHRLPRCAAGHPRSHIGDDYFATAGRWVEADFAVEGVDGDKAADRGQRLRPLGRGGHPQAGGQVPLPGRHDHRLPELKPSGTTPWWSAT